MTISPSGDIKACDMYKNSPSLSENAKATQIAADLIPAIRVFHSTLPISKEFSM
jgi:hypothetical protein